MREVNLLNFYMLKMLEVICLVACTVAILVSTISISGFTYEDGGGTKTFFGDAPQGKSLIYQLAGLWVLAFFHTIHNNFLTNLRLACRDKDAAFAPCWTPINYLICKFGKGDEMNGLQFCCRDRCCKPQTIVKQIIYIAVFLVVRANLGTGVAEFTKGSEDFDQLT